MNYTLLSGGVRKESTNNKLAQSAYGYLSKLSSLKVDLFDDLTTGIPFVSESVEPLPKTLIPARESLIHSDKVIVFSPILNGGYHNMFYGWTFWIKCCLQFKYDDQPFFPIGYAAWSCVKRHFT